MALRGSALVNESLTQLLGGYEVNRRVENWLRVYMSIRWSEGTQYSFGKFPASALVRFLSPRGNHREVLHDECRRTFLPEKIYSWLTDSERQNKWLLNHLNGFSGAPVQQSPNDIHPVNASVFLAGRERLIAIFDAWGFQGQSQEKFVNDVKDAWINTLKRDKDLDWFNGEVGRKGYEILWAWLVKEAPITVVGHRMFVSHEELLTFFDQKPLSEDQFKLMMIKVKQSWSRKKHRMNLKGRSQYNFILKDKTVERLDKLAGKHGLSRAEILDVLINDEFGDEVHISRRLAQHAALTRDTPDENSL